MNLEVIIFYFFIILSGLSALAILFVKNLFKAALLLLTSLLCLAALYVFSFAEFVAVTQIMIYAGGIIVVIVFGIMLTSRFSGNALMVENRHIFSGILAATALFGILYNNIGEFSFQASKTMMTGNKVEETGKSLLSTFSLPFEVAGILLLVALIGASVVSAEKNTSE